MLMCDVPVQGSDLAQQAVGVRFPGAGGPSGDHIREVRLHLRGACGRIGGKGGWGEEDPSQG